MKTLSLLVIFAAIVALSFAATQCTDTTTGGSVACKGPVSLAYTDSKCSNILAAVNVFSSTQSTGGTCYSFGTGSNLSFKWSCGTYLESTQYASTDCSNQWVSKSYQKTSTCFPVNGGSFSAVKLACASAATISASVLFLAVLALLALLMN